MSNDILVCGLGLLVVCMGSLNSVLGKIRAKPLGAYDVFVSLFNSIILCLFYGSVVIAKVLNGSINRKQFSYLFSPRPKDPRARKYSGVGHDLNAHLLATEMSRATSHLEAAVPPPQRNSPVGWQAAKLERVREVWRRSGAWKYLFICGAFDSLGNTLSFIAQPYVPGVLIGILNQCTAIFVALASMVVLRRSYTLFQVASLGLVLTGALVAIVPKFHKTSDFGCAGKGFFSTCTRVLLYVLIAILANLPTAISFVVKELLFLDWKAFNSSKLHIEETARSPSSCDSHSNPNGRQPPAVATAKAMSSTAAHRDADGREPSSISTFGVAVRRGQRTVNTLDDPAPTADELPRKGRYGSETDDPDEISESGESERRLGREGSSNEGVALLDIFIVGAFGCFFSILFFPLAFPINSLLGNSGCGSTYEYIRDAIQCFAGNTPASCIIRDADCERWGCCTYASRTYALYITANIVFNVLVLFILQQASALMAFICMKAILPLSLLLFVSFDWPLLDPSDIGASPLILVSLALCLAGIGLYHIATIQKNQLSEAEFGGRQPPCLWPLFRRRQVHALENLN